MGKYKQRGVIRALEDYFGEKFDEKTQFINYKKGWLIKHEPACSGFTILSRGRPQS